MHRQAGAATAHVPERFGLPEQPPDHREALAQGKRSGRIRVPYNVSKRLVKSPKVNIRDSGVLHSLMGLGTLDDVLSHPVAGTSREGFVIENLIAAAPFGTDAWFYRTRSGAEIDLLLQLPDRQLRAIEIKRSSAPRAARGLELAASDLGAAERFVVHPGREPFPLSGTTMAIPLTDLMERLEALA